MIYQHMEKKRMRTIDARPWRHLSLKVIIYIYLYVTYE